MKKIIFYSITIVGLLGLLVPQTVKADFIVMPIPYKETVIKEVCSGISVGAKVFRLKEGTIYKYKDLYIDSIYETSNGKLMQVTGVYNPVYPSKSGRYIEDGSFLLAPTKLPSPTNGTKGPFYYLWSGVIIFAKYL